MFSSKQNYHALMDATLKHPFTMVIAGPSGSGKSTFVEKLLLARDDIINKKFNYIYFILGTDLQENEIFSDLIYELKKSIEKVQVIELNNSEYMTKQQVIKPEFYKDLQSALKQHHEHQQQGCVIFDDLMQELVQTSNILVKCFTVLSTHCSVSFIYLTQNLFSGGSGKSTSDMVSVYRNTKYLVLFQSNMDNSSVALVVRKMGPGGKRNEILREMLNQIMSENRYVLIRSDIPELKYCSDIFQEKEIFSPIIKEQVKFMKVFSPNFGGAK